MAVLVLIMMTFWHEFGGAPPSFVRRKLVWSQYNGSFLSGSGTLHTTARSQRSWHLQLVAHGNLERHKDSSADSVRGDPDGRRVMAPVWCRGVTLRSAPRFALMEAMALAANRCRGLRGRPRTPAGSHLATVPLRLRWRWCRRYRSAGHLGAVPMPPIGPRCRRMPPRPTFLRWHPCRRCSARNSCTARPAQRR
jgi:hypothetical protein